MNETEKRRKQIIEILNKSDVPISGSVLAENFDVSRQVIVQDIAILKAENYKIISKIEATSSSITKDRVASLKYRTETTK